MSGGNCGSSEPMEKWIPILDYAVQRGVSTSTLRRYIKANKIRYRLENGRYLLAADSAAPKPARAAWDGAGAAATAPSSSGISVYARVRELEEQLAHAQEQISELKMLIAIYEEKLSG